MEVHLAHAGGAILDGGVELVSCGVRNCLAFGNRCAQVFEYLQVGSHFHPGIVKHLTDSRKGL